MMGAKDRGCLSRQRHPSGRAGRWAKAAGAERRAGLLPGLFILVLAALLLPGCGGGGSTGGVGERVGNDKIAVTVHSFKSYSKITTENGDVLTPSRRGGVVLIADMTVRNLQDASQRVDPDDVRLVTSDDRYYSSGNNELFTAEFPDEFQRLEAKTLRSGKKVRGMVAFLVPKGTVLENVTYVSDPDIKIDLGGRKARPPAPERPPGMGQTAKGGGLAIIVHSVTYPTQLTHGYWTTTAKAGSKLVMVDITVKNLDRRPSYKIDPLSVAILDGKGTRWSSFNRSALGLADSEQLPLKRLRPGQQERGKVVVSMPKNAKVTRIRYEVGVLGPPLEVSAAR